MSYPPPPIRSMSRQRTTSSSSSTHSNNGPGSRRSSLAQLTRDGSGSGTPVTNQASNESMPRGSLPSSSSSSLHVSSSSMASVPTDSAVTGEVFRFGVPPPPSPAYTVCLLACFVGWLLVDLFLVIIGCGFLTIIVNHLLKPARFCVDLCHGA